MVVDQMGLSLVDPDGNYIGWDGPILPNGQNLSTMSKGRLVKAKRIEDTRLL